MRGSARNRIGERLEVFELRGMSFVECDIKGSVAQLPMDGFEVSVTDHLVGRWKHSVG